MLDVQFLVWRKVDKKSTLSRLLQLS